VNATQKKVTITVAGTQFDLADVESAITVLENAKGIMVKQPLAKAGNPLAGMDYHALAATWRADTEHDSSTLTKQAVIAALKDLVATATATAKPVAKSASKSTSPKPATEKVA
jgi:hypothetical protein